MRKFKEFTADFFVSCDPVTGASIYDSDLITIDLYSVVSFNPGKDNLHTTIRLSDGSGFDLKIKYEYFKKLMFKEVPEFHLTSN